MPLFGYTDDDLINAQWDIVRALRFAFEHGQETGIRAKLSALRAPTPEAWIAEAARLLIAHISACEQAAAKSDGEALRMTARSEYFESLVKTYKADPLHAQVERLTQERDHWRSEATKLTEHERELQADLERAWDELDRLEREVKALNRLVVAQQEALNDREI
ncbi:MAG: hypothetical protein JW934_06955 [Anaerolineae bacterium]|nr:hypothetical protein [Anaerolineae bacterium]